MQGSSMPHSSFTVLGQSLLRASLADEHPWANERLIDWFRTRRDKRTNKLRGTGGGWWVKTRREWGKKKKKKSREKQEFSLQKVFGSFHLQIAPEGSNILLYVKCQSRIINRHLYDWTMIHSTGTVPADTKVWCSCHITAVPVRSFTPLISSWWYYLSLFVCRGESG